MAVDEIICKCKLSYPETLRQIPVGESRTFDMSGRRYSAIMTAKSRMHKSGEACFNFVTDEVANTITLYRIS